MKYMISSYVANIAVGLMDEETAQQDINLSHNLFNTNVNNNYFNGILSFNTLKKFYRFLIHKNLFADWGIDTKYSTQLKEAANKARITINKEVGYRNFMIEISKSDETYQAYRLALK